MDTNSLLSSMNTTIAKDGQDYSTTREPFFSLPRAARLNIFSPLDYLGELYCFRLKKRLYPPPPEIVDISSRRFEEEGEVAEMALQRRACNLTNHQVLELL